MRKFSNYITEQAEQKEFELEKMPTIEGRLEKLLEDNNISVSDELISGIKKVFENEFYYKASWGNSDEGGSGIYTDEYTSRKEAEDAIKKSGYDDNFDGPVEEWSYAQIIKTLDLMHGQAFESKKEKECKCGGEGECQCDKECNCEGECTCESK